MCLWSLRGVPAGPISPGTGRVSPSGCTHHPLGSGPGESPVDVPAPTDLLALTDTCDESVSERKRGILMEKTRSFLSRPSYAKYDSQEARNAAYRERWRRPEDDFIAKSVELHGRDWATIIRLVDERFNAKYKSRTIQERYDRMLSPNVKKGRLTDEESNVVLQHVREFGERGWAIVARAVRHDTKRVQKHWHQVLKPRHPDLGLPVKVRPRPEWTPEMDARLRTLGAPGCDWARVGRVLGVTARLARERFQAFAPALQEELSPDREWTSEEDERISEAHVHFGRQWDTIARMLIHRRPSGVKNRWERVLVMKLIQPLPGCAGFLPQNGTEWSSAFRVAQLPSLEAAPPEA